MRITHAIGLASLLLVCSAQAATLVDEHFDSPTPFPPGGWTQTSTGHCPVQDWVWNSGYAEGRVTGSAFQDGETRIITYPFSLSAGERCQITFLSMTYRTTPSPGGFGVELYRGSSLIWSAVLLEYADWENHLYLVPPAEFTASDYRVEWYVYSDSSPFSSNAHFCLDDAMISSNNISVQPQSLGRLRAMY
jgi:hypothetical protein